MFFAEKTLELETSLCRIRLLINCGWGVFVSGQLNRKG